MSDSQPALALELQPQRQWILRLFVPLIAWSLFALLLWNGLPFLIRTFPTSDIETFKLFAVASALFCGAAAFATTSAFIVYASRGGIYPKATWLLAPAAIILGIGFSILLGPFQGILPTLLLLLAAPLLGDMLARLFEKKEYLVPALFVAMVADSWSVFRGLSKVMVETGVVQHVAVSYPVPDFASGGVTNPLPFVGIMDWIFIAMLTHFLVRFDISLKRLWLVLLTGLGGGFLLLVATHKPVPLLLTISPAFILFYWRDVRPRQRDLALTFAFIVGLIALFYGLSFLRTASA